MYLIFAATNLWLSPWRKNQDKQILLRDCPLSLHGEFGCSSWKSRCDRIDSEGSIVHSIDWFWSFWDLDTLDTFPWVATQLHIQLHPQTIANLPFSSASPLFWLFHLPCLQTATRSNPPSPLRDRFQPVPPSFLLPLASQSAALSVALVWRWEYLRLHVELLAWRKGSNLRG